MTIGKAVSYYFNNALLATATAVAAREGTIYFIEVSNPTTDDVYLQLFDVAAADVTLGTTTPTLALLVPAGTSTTDRGAMDKMFPEGLYFGTSITAAITTTATGNTAPGTGATVNIGYL